MPASMPVRDVAGRALAAAAAGTTAAGARLAAILADYRRATTRGRVPRRVEPPLPQADSLRTALNSAHDQPGLPLERLREADQVARVAGIELDHAARRRTCRPDR